MINKKKMIVLVYLPWVLSLILEFDPILSFLTAWIGSFFIFYITIFSMLAPLNLMESKTFPVMRPIILVQIIFAGFMCCTSVFYFIDHYGQGEVDLISQCQRFSLLAHSSLVTGMILMMKTEKNRVSKITTPDLSVILGICLLSYLSSKGLEYLPSLIQFKYPLNMLSITSAVYLLVKGISVQHFSYATAGLIMFGIHFIASTLTGYKEGIIVQIITLTFISFHYFRHLILVTAIPCLALALYVLPTYTLVMRAESWTNGKSAYSAREQAYQTFFNDESEQLIIENNWAFLTNRFSEIGMFIKYVKHTPDHQDFVGLEIVGDALISLIPRSFWNDKPVTEEVAMRRVYDAGVANKSSTVSAKTRPVVDGYLMAGATGVLLTMLLYGMVTQTLSNKAEALFGGYELGTIIIFNSLFQQLWRGNTLEFLINNVVYGLLLMLIIYVIMKAMNLLVNTHNKNEGYSN
jgi:hypothetical protein